MIFTRRKWVVRIESGFLGGRILLIDIR